MNHSKSSKLSSFGFGGATTGGGTLTTGATTGAGFVCCCCCWGGGGFLGGAGSGEEDSSSISILIPWIIVFLLFVRQVTFGKVLQGVFQRETMHTPWISSYLKGMIDRQACRYLLLGGDIQRQQLLSFLDQWKAFSSKWRPYREHQDYSRFLLPLSRGR